MRKTDFIQCVSKVPLIALSRSAEKPTAAAHARRTIKREGKGLSGIQSVVYKIGSRVTTRTSTACYLVSDNQCCSECLYDYSFQKQLYLLPPSVIQYTCPHTPFFLSIRGITTPAEAQASTPRFFFRSTWIPKKKKLEAKMKSTPGSAVLLSHRDVISTLL